MPVDRIKKMFINEMMIISPAGKTMGSTSIAYISLGKEIISKIFCTKTIKTPEKKPMQTPLKPIIKA